MAPDRIVERLTALQAQIERLLATAPAGERLRAGALVVLAGPPNVGKSSLFNALLGADRAIVTESPGTTRDAIEAHTEFLGWPVRLVDTAGLRESTEEAERLGVGFSRRYVEAADVVLACEAEGGETGKRGGESDGWRASGTVIQVRTKADLAPSLPLRIPASGIHTSVVSGEGLDTLKVAVVRAAFGGQATLTDLEPALTRERHRIALTRAQDALGAALPQLTRQGEPVLAAHHLREAARALEELIGAVDVEDVLDRVFRSFCVGK